MIGCLFRITRHSGANEEAAVIKTYLRDGDHIYMNTVNDH